MAVPPSSGQERSRGLGSGGVISVERRHRMLGVLKHPIVEALPDVEDATIERIAKGVDIRTEFSATYGSNI